MQTETNQTPAYFQGEAFTNTHAMEIRLLKPCLQKYLGLDEKDVEKIKFFKTKYLPNNYQAQRDDFHDPRLDEVTIAVVPDSFWVKGNQPSESSAEKQLILIKQSYFEAQTNPDEIAWMVHELAHCQYYLDSKTEQAYQTDMQTLAFEDLRTKHPYPNNLVEQYTFTKQFQHLKQQGKSREDILTMLSRYYSEEDRPFFDRLLDGVYGK